MISLKVFLGILFNLFSNMKQPFIWTELFLKAQSIKNGDIKENPQKVLENNNFAACPLFLITHYYIKVNITRSTLNA